MNSEEDDRTVIRPPRAPLAARTSAAPAGGAGTGAASPGPPGATQTFQATAQLTSAAPLPDVTTSHSITLPPGTRLLEFEVKQTIGEGGFGIVYAAWDHSLDRRVALKEYMPSAIASRAGQSQILPRSERHRETFDAGLKSFVNEAKLLAQFDHPSLLKVYRFWEANGTAYMVMPFLEGSTVRDTVRAMPGPPDEAWIRGLLTPLFDALAMLHAAQIYHRDIAPDNIHLLADTGRPLLLDFGAARRVIGDMTQALTAILKPGYAPVEQYADIPGLKQGPWTDVYALAAVVHWMITGKTPPPSVGRMFDDAHVPLGRRVAGRYSASFLEAIDRALVVMPDKRTQTVEAFRNDLLGLPAGEPAAVAARPSTAPAQTRGPATIASASAPTASGAPPPGAVVDPFARTRMSTRQDTAPHGQTALAGDSPPQAAVASPTARRRGIVAGIVVTLALLGAAWYFFLGRVPAPPVVDAAGAPAKPAVAAAPAAAPVPEPPPAAASAAAATQLPVTARPAEATGTESAQPTQAGSAEPPPPAVTTGEPPAARPRVAAVPTPAKPPTNETRPSARKPAESTKPERREAPIATEQRDTDSNKAECARLFQRLSIGEASPELIERVRTLHCR